MQIVRQSNVMEIAQPAHPHQAHNLKVSGTNPINDGNVASSFGPVQ
jgi:hypothetical protein